MPSWKKVITSGSDASLASLFVTNSVTSSIFSGSRYIGQSFTGSLQGTASFAVSSSRAVSSSFAISASWAPNTGGSSQWTSSGANIYYNVGNVGIGNTSPGSALDVDGVIFGGNATAVNGSIILQDQYSNGHLTNFGTNQSSGGPVIGYAVYPSSSTNVFASATGITIERTAFSLDGNSFRWYTGGSQTVSIGAQATLSEKMTFTNAGNLGISQTNPTTAKLVVGGTAGQEGLDLATSDQYANLRVIRNSLSSIDKDMYIGYQSGVASQLHLYSNNVETITVSGSRVGVGTISPSSKLDVSGNITTNDTISDTTGYRILKPKGGTYITQTSVLTGAIKITYPVGYTNTMHTVKVRVYEYQTNESFTITFGGYNYIPTPTWVNCFAYIEGNPSIDRNFTVRFGYDGTNMVVYIGELASTWSYPQVFIEEVGIGFSGVSTSWTEGTWAIGFEASAFSNVTATVSNTAAHTFVRNGADTYYSLGNAGIGITSPTAKLHISSSTNNALRIESQENSDTNPVVYIEGNKGGSSPYTATLIELRSNTEFRGKGIHMTTAGSNTRWFAGVPYNFGGSGYQIGYDGSTNGRAYTPASASLFIDTSRNVIVGGTSAGGKLTIDAGATAYSVYAISQGTTWASGIRAQAANANNGYFIMSFVSGSQYGSLQAGDSSAYRNISLNHQGGNVVIGATSPGAKLDVAGGALNVRSSAAFSSDAGNLARGNFLNYISYNATCGDVLTLGVQNTSAMNAGAIFRYSLGLSGNASGQSLTVSTVTTAGTVTTRASLSTGGTFTVSGDLVAYGSPSDISLKTNIKPLRGALEKINKLQGVSFTWKKNTEVNKLTGIKDDIGFIAQEVKKVLPELVRENENGLLSLRDKSITALLVEAIKEQQKQIDELKQLLKNK